MRLTKVFGLAAIAAVAAMAFVGASSALAVDEIVVCKKLVTNGALCPDGEFFPVGTKILALATNAELDSLNIFLPPVVCEDSTAVAETTVSMGGTLGIKIISLEFGTLSTPTLGKGCKNAAEVHTKVPITGVIEAEPKGAVDEWWLKASGNAEILKPFGLNTNCIYGAEDLKSKIDLDTGKHKLAHEEKGLGIILARGVLSKKAGSGVLCPASGDWIADYVIYLVDPPNKDEPTLGWLALYKEL